MLAPFRDVVHLNDLVAVPAGTRIDVLERFGGRSADRILVQNTGKKEIKVHLAGGVSGGYAIVRTKEDLDVEVVVSEFFVSGANEPFDVTLFRRG